MCTVKTDMAVAWRRNPVEGGEGEGAKEGITNRMSSVGVVVYNDSCRRGGGGRGGGRGNRRQSQAKETVTQASLDDDMDSYMANGR